MSAMPVHAASRFCHAACLLPLLLLCGAPPATATAVESAGNLMKSLVDTSAEHHVRHVNHHKRHRASATGEKRAGRIKDHATLGVSHRSDLDEALAELERLQAKLIAKKGFSMNPMRVQAKELVELEAMIKQIQAAEAKTKSPPADHPELKLEIKRLSSKIDDIEVGHLEFELPARPGVSEMPGHGGTARQVKINLEPLAEGAAIRANSRQQSKTERDTTNTQTVTQVQEKGLDVDTEMPYGELEPFGREDTAQELTEASIRESDEMVDQLERAEVAEEKRAVFRALTRLRGAAITSFDGVARSQTGNLDGYSKVHKWRVTHPLHHLADEESDVSKWAFPDNADF